ncbi:MAG: colanic acid biosynthesis glycosyltransferase WcaL, partial [Flavobacteriia bacterium]|nr:colanic acid biosynthesis glycosyltransferase WcaL [Flavobacteriia bacterium]
MNNLIVFKANAFPTFSETFIVSNITAAIDAGFKVKIIVDT